MSNLDIFKLNRDVVHTMEAELKKVPAQLKLFVKYYSCDGIFTGELFIPKDTILVGKIHKYKNLNVLTKGELSVLVGDRIERVKAPFVTVSPPGIKRIAYAHEDSIWMTFHATNEVNPDFVEDCFIAQSEEEYLDFCKKEQLLPLFERT